MKLTARTLLAALVVLVAPAAAAHAGSQLGLSYDGQSWSTSLSRPLFDPEVRWVPGDVRTARFYVRNQSDGRGDLIIAVEDVARDVLTGTGRLDIAARVGAGPWSEISSPGMHVLADTDDVPSGTTVPVDVRVSLEDLAPNRTMVLGSDLDFSVTLTDSRARDGAGGDEGNGGGDDNGGSIDLPGTGAGFTAAELALGLVLLTSGALLLAGRRRQDDDPDPILVPVQEDYR